MSILKTIIIILALVVAGLAIVVFTGVFSDTNIKSPNSYMQNEASDSVRKLTIQEKYNDGQFTIYGAIQTPTPCHSIEATSAKTGDNLYLISIITKEGANPCAQVVTDQIFEYTFSAPEDAMFVGALDGEMVEFNRIKIPEGEDFVNPLEYTKG